MAALERSVRAARLLDHPTARAVRDNHFGDARAADADVHRAETAGHRLRNADRLTRNDEHHLHHLPLHREAVPDFPHVGGGRGQVHRHRLGDSLLHPLAADRSHDFTAR